MTYTRLIKYIKNNQYDSFCNLLECLDLTSHQKHQILINIIETDNQFFMKYFCRYFNYKNDDLIYFFEGVIFYNSINILEFILNNLPIGVFMTNKQFILETICEEGSVEMIKLLINMKINIEKYLIDVAVNSGNTDIANFLSVSL